ncbi:hypothetical protein [Pseudosulfitobacter sp. DSM 107133]|uniref:hypothetical protein n=1 Tax=Pseudosulfitobacter sp. DSM 107133 TaxID=2883100 RepID=UPI0013B3E8F2|nr:hypothetical protein [Pseudosulfitobacter sp. DSM 107133]UOA29008.1 hypothetical protein DSM107133_03767 [Pseudosulfitobacter sp. DSM 107133]
MHEKRFYHEVLGPTINLLNRTEQNVCVEPNFNDLISLAKQVASAAYHFREPILRHRGEDRVDLMADQTAEELRQRLGDVVDSSKHGVLRNPDRTVTFRASLAFEYDQRFGYRFLRTEVLATNGRYGSYNICDTIQNFLPFLAKELSLPGSVEERTLKSHPFLEWAETYLMPESGFDLEAVGIRTYQKDANGILTLSNLPEVKFRVIQH